MKKMNVNRLATLVVALLMIVMVPMSAMAEGSDITTPTDLAPVTDVENTTDENASNVTEAEAVATEEPVVETPAPTEEPAVETPAPTEEIVADPDQNNEEPTESLVSEAPAGRVDIYLRTEGPLYYGDEVTLAAQVSGVEGNYRLTWQVKVELDKWVDVEEGFTYKFILTPQNANLEYRVVLDVIE